MRLYPPLLGARVAVSATLASELHEFGALAAALTTASRGWKVVYLGPNLPAEDIAETVHTAHAELVLISIVVNHARVASELERLVARLPEGVRMVLGGAGVASLPALPAGVEVFASIEDLSSVL
jgi:methanogenic corrinoid protein MtbC1